MIRKLIFLAVVLVTLSASLGAATINGSLVLTSLGAVLDGTNLLDSTLIEPVGVIGTPGLSTGLRTGDYLAVALGTNGTGGAINITNMNSFVVNLVGVGVFTATSGLIVSQDANFLDVYYLGNFAPLAGGPLDTFDVSPTSVRISMNFTGSSTSYSGTLASPPEDAPIPEPGTYALLGAGLVGLVAFRRRTA